MNSKGKEQSFTLMELMIVVVIIGIIAGFAIPSYQKAMARQQVKRLILTANLIAGAQEIYKARNGRYWCDGSPACSDLNNINASLGIQIIPESGVTYTTFAPTIQDFEVTITDEALFNIHAFLSPPPSMTITCTNLSAMNVCP
ncbi:MAG TPA: hypothetical protein DE315_06095 [Candidatus Omnitrophica bacterium]|nr:hypothetical protein [Candidatus Omnitrophota bacterium]